MADHHSERFNSFYGTIFSEKFAWKDQKWFPMNLGSGEKPTSEDSDVTVQR
jgi:hypothetical protein